MHHQSDGNRDDCSEKGFLEGKLKLLARELGLAIRLFFTGAIPHDDIPYYIAAADICVARLRYRSHPVVKAR